MATDLFMRALTGTSWYSGRDTAMQVTTGNTTWNQWLGELSTAVGTGGATTGSISTTTGPVTQRTATTVSGFVSRPIAADVAISANVAFSIWGSENNADANCGAQVLVFVIAPDGSTTLWIDSQFGTEFGTSAAQQIWNVAPTGRTLKRGERLAVVLAIADAGGTMLTGRTVTYRWNGSNANTGDSKITFDETITFVDDTVAPSGTKFYLRDTASSIVPHTPRIVTKVLSRTAGSTDVKASNAQLLGPIRTPGLPWAKRGRILHWYTEPLAAFTLGGLCFVDFDADGNGLGSVHRAELHLVNRDGSDPTLWARTYNIPATDGDLVFAGYETAVASGQRLRFSLFEDDLADSNIGSVGSIRNIQYNNNTANFDFSITFEQTILDDTFVSAGALLVDDETVTVSADAILAESTTLWLKSAFHSRWSSGFDAAVGITTDTEIIHRALHHASPDAIGDVATAPTLTTITGPGTFLTSQAANLQFLSRPLDEDIEYTGDTKFSIWGSVSDAAANVGLHARVYVVDRLGEVDLWIDSPCGTELTASTDLYEWTSSPASRTLVRGERLLILVGVSDAGGTQASGHTATIRYGGTAATTSDSRVAFSQAITFDTNTRPDGTRFHLRSADAEVQHTTSDVERLASTTPVNSSTTAVVNRATGPHAAPGIPWTSTAGGTPIVWFTKPLEAGTMGGTVFARVIESGASVSWSVRAEIYITDTYGENEQLWGRSYGWANNNDSSASALNNFTVTGPTQVITYGQRLKFIFYLDDAYNQNQTSGSTVAITYNINSGVQQAFFEFGETLTEISGPVQQVAADARLVLPTATESLTVATTSVLIAQRTTSVDVVLQAAVEQTLSATARLRLTVLKTVAVSSHIKSQNRQLRMSATAAISTQIVSRTATARSSARLQKFSTLVVGTSGLIGPTLTVLSLTVVSSALLSGVGRVRAVNTNAVLTRLPQDTIVAVGMFSGRRF